MSLSAGTKLGPYDILASLGAGGMGEVYKARDTRLGRIIAVKVLHEHSDRPELRQRLEREARAISALNHPHICTLHDIGREGTIDYLVMEFLEGESLADRLKRGALPFDQTMRIATEVAGALDRAHRNGIIHRDFKPGNIMLTKDGAKVLDFGLAKLAHARCTPAQSTETLTSEHAIVGTLAYMAPEQLAGQECDPRSDIFALGIVLYEMASGRRPFGGDSQAGLIAEIMRAEMPELPNAPPQFAHVVARCLAKNPDERWQSASDVKLELQWTLMVAASPSPTVPPAQSHRWLWIAMVGCLALGMIVSAVWPRRRSADSVYRFTLPPPPDAEFLNAPNRTGLALSPNGATLLFLATRNGVSRLWVQRLDSPTARELPGTENASAPFWAPDGRSFAFFAGSALQRIDVDGSNLQTIVSNVRAPRGGTWGKDGAILFSPSNVSGSGIYRVPANGGQAVQITTADMTHGPAYHAFPILLDDGNHFLYRDSGAFLDASTPAWYSASIDNAKSATMVLSSNSFVAVARPNARTSRYLIWNRDDTVVGQKWDAVSSRPSGEIVPLAGPVGYREANFTVSDSGLLVYGNTAASLQLKLVDRTGNPSRVLSESGPLISPALSPDGTTVAVLHRFSGDLTVTDISRGVTSRLATSVGSPILWSPEGSRLAFTRANKVSILEAGTGREVTLPSAGLPQTFVGWMPDGRSVLYNELGSQGRHNLGIRPIDPSGKPRRLLNTASDETHAAVSPDGQWIAYVTDESGHFEVYAQRLEGGPRVQVSNQGGNTPKWRKDEKELFYEAVDGSIVSVAVDPAGNRLNLSPPRILFALPAHYVAGNSYDVSPEGQRFAVLAPYSRRPHEPLVVVVNWPALIPN